MPTNAATEAARRPNGQFGEQHREEPEVALTVEPATVMMRDARGMRVAITPGVLDDNARHLYANGQCLAMAVALARSRPGMGVAVLRYDADDGSTLIRHCWATDDTLTLDVNGDYPGQIPSFGDDESWLEYYGPGELDALLEESADQIGRQDVELAATIAPSVWAQMDPAPAA